jgi:hypothetical protein
VSANISRGKERERAESRQFHQTEIPVLVAPIVLRSWGLGQCDLVRFSKQKKLIEIREVKGQRGHLSFGQRRRLLEAGKFLGKMLGANVRLELNSEHL